MVNPHTNSRVQDELDAKGTGNLHDLEGGWAEQLEESQKMIFIRLEKI